MVVVDVLRVRELDVDVVAQIEQMQFDGRLGGFAVRDDAMWSASVT
ncbi:MAG TPA: hypothetical protein VGF63_05015 [Solirubrobacteraceae bacterium]